VNNKAIPLAPLRRDGNFPELHKKKQVTILDGTSHRESESEWDRILEDALWNEKFGFEETSRAYQRRVYLDNQEVRCWDMYKSIESLVCRATRTSEYSVSKNPQASMKLY
jgi:hypothetical protein